MTNDKWEEQCKIEARKAWCDQSCQDNEGGVDSVGFIAGYLARAKKEPSANLSRDTITKILTLQKQIKKQKNKYNKQLEKLQEQNKLMRELLKESDSIIDDYLNWRSDKRMDYFDVRARKFRAALEKVGQSTEIGN